MHFRNWRVSTKQLFVFGLLLVLMAISNSMSIRNTRDIRAQVDQVTDTWLPRIIAISDVNFGAAALRLHQLQYAIVETDSLRQLQTTQMGAAIDRMNQSLDRYAAISTDEQAHSAGGDERAVFERFEELWEEYQDISIEFIVLSRSGESEEAIALLRGQRAQDVFDLFRVQLLALGSINVQNSTAASTRAEDTYDRTQRASYTIFLLTFFLCAAIALSTARVVTRPLRQLTEAAGLVADGDLDVQIPSKSTDEVGLLARSFNDMTRALKDARQRMQEQAEELRLRNADLEETMHVLRETQEQLVMREKMAGLGTLVAGVAHEINNPIGVILSTVDTSGRCITRIDEGRAEVAMEETSARRFDDAVGILRENVDITRSAGERIANLVRSLGSFAHVDESEFQVVDLRGGIEDSLTLLGGEALREIDIVREFDDIPSIPCHPAELNQVFFNVLRNSTQAIDGKGEITIRTRTEGTSVQIQFADTGRGIPDDRLPHIFDFGFSSDASRIKMGSGLTTSYRIIQRHNGDMQVESSEGQGTTVTITLPTTLPRST